MIARPVGYLDLRVGGDWRYVMVTEADLEVGFHGTYRELVMNERVVSTEVYEGYPACRSRWTRSSRSRSRAAELPWSGVGRSLRPGPQVALPPTRRSASLP